MLLARCRLGFIECSQSVLEPPDDTHARGQAKQRPTFLGGILRLPTRMLKRIDGGIDCSQFPQDIATRAGLLGVPPQIKSQQLAAQGR